jgi:hypothetical protein
MIKNVKRRDAIKAAIAGGGLLALRSANAETGAMKVRALAGDWQCQGQPCAIFQQGSILLVVDGKGSLGTARMTDDKKFVILNGTGWVLGLEGTVADDNKTINWSDDSSWTRVK